MENMNEICWVMDDLLLKAKANPMPIFHDFDTRFRVWTEQILKNRFRSIINTGGDYDYINRMVNLTLEDYDRLVNRARKEFVTNEDINQYHERNNKLLIVTKKVIKLYEEQNHD